MIITGDTGSSKSQTLPPLSQNMSEFWKIAKRVQSIWMLSTVVKVALSYLSEGTWSARETTTLKFQMERWVLGHIAVTINGNFLLYLTIIIPEVYIISLRSERIIQIIKTTEFLHIVLQSRIILVGFSWVVMSYRP